MSAPNVRALLSSGALDSQLDAAYREGALRGWREALRQAPKLARDGGNCEIEHRATYRGIAFDPGLIDEATVSGLEELCAAAAQDEAELIDKLSRCLAHAERVRADAEWLEGAESVVRGLVSWDSYPERIAELEVGTREWLKLVSDYKQTKPDKYRGSEAERAHREWKARKR